MPYSNLTSVLDTAALTPLMTQIATLSTGVAPHSINLTAKEIGTMYKMNEKRQSLGTRGLQIANDNPALVPHFLDLNAAQVDMTRYLNALALEMKLEQMLQGVRHGRMASGSEVMLFIKGLYKSLEAAAEQNVAGASALFDDLKVYYDLPSQPDAGEAEPFPADA